MNPQIRSAIALAKRAHNGQRRSNGDAFVEHPIAVMRLLLEVGNGLPLQAYLAAVLHDVLEDTTVTYEELRECAGEEVAEVVRLLTKKKGDCDFLPRLAASKDRYPYILLIKLADRIHNLETLDALPKARQLKILSETRELCLPFFEKQIATVCVPYLQPYQKLLARLRQSLLPP
jgi:(p)ppGpp synthase/HD superfamily hydrolase